MTLAETSATGVAEDLRFKAPDGADLVWRRFLPANGRSPRAVLAVVHGFGEHGGRYGFLADAMTGRGYAVATYDLRGHGLSPGQRGYVERFGDYLDDTKAFLDVVAEWFPGAPLVFVGHSMGGLIAAAYVERRAEPAGSTAAGAGDSRGPAAIAASDPGGPALAGLVLSSPFFALRLRVSPLKLRSARLLSRLAPRTNMANPMLSEQLSHDPAVVAAADADALSHRRTTPRWAAEILDAQRETLAGIERLDLPLLLLYAGDDLIADAAVTRRAAERLSAPDARVIRYDGYYHEIFNELGRERVFDDLAEWLDGLET